MNFRLPQAFQKSTQTKITASKPALTASAVAETNLDMSDEVAGNGLCPDCKKPMERALVEDEQCWVCLPCRVALPVRDPEHAVDIGEPVQPEQPVQTEQPATPAEPTTEQPDENKNEGA